VESERACDQTSTGWSVGVEEGEIVGGAISIPYKIGENEAEDVPLPDTEVVTVP
jgi:hypothetical protein